MWKLPRLSWDGSERWEEAVHMPTDGHVAQVGFRMVTFNKSQRELDCSCSDSETCV